MLKDKKAVECAADIARRFLLAAPAGSVCFSAADLCTPTTALPVLEPFLQLHPDEDRAAVISMWSQWYFARLLPIWTRINLLYRWQLPSDPQAIRFCLEDTGVPRGFLLDDDGEQIAPGTNIFARFHPLVTGHLHPLCQTLSHLAGIAPSLFWNNAAIRIAYGFTLAQEQGLNTTDADPLLTSKTQPDGTLNRLFAPVRHIDDTEGGSAHMIRRQCCLRYKLSDAEYCPSCPLLLAERRKNRRV